jgi:RNA polymerase sigma-70 factor, ECF subfamily
MTDADLLAQRFEAQRDRLRAVALRMLGSSHEADDAVQEAWLRLSRTDTDDVDNLGGWLTTVVARICLDMLRARSAKHEVSLEPPPEPVAEISPEDEALLADSVGLALLVVLDTLTPAERLAFVLHDMFGVPFEEIAPIVGRTPLAARQLASRARRRVRSGANVPEVSAAHQRAVVSAFLAASRHGDFEGLLQLLDPQVVLRADPTVVAFGAAAEVRGPQGVAETFAGRAQGARLALVDGLAGAVWSVGGRPKVVFAFTLHADRVIAVEMLGDPETLETLDLEPLREPRRR